MDILLLLGISYLLIMIWTLVVTQIISSETFLRAICKEGFIRCRPVFSVKNTFMGPFRIIVEPANLLLGNFQGEMKLLFMMGVFASYLIIIVFVNSNLSYIFHNFDKIQITSSKESNWEYVKYSLVFFTAWYIRLRHLLNIKWKYAVDQYNNALRIKYSSREIGPVAHQALVLNLALSIIHNALWAEKDLRFLLLRKDYLHSFKDDFSDRKIIEDLNWESQNYEDVRDNIERMIAWLRSKYRYRDKAHDKLDT